MVYTAKNFLTRYSSVAKSSVTGVFSELNQYRSSIRTVSLVPRPGDEATGQYQISTHISVSDLYEQHVLGLFLLN